MSASAPQALTLVLPFLPYQSLICAGRVCQELKVASEADYLWREKLQNFNIGPFFLPSHQRLKDVFKQMQQQQLIMDQEIDKYQKRLAEWKPRRYKCGRRRPSPGPTWGMVTRKVVENGAIGGFKVHPNSCANLTVEFGVDLVKTAKYLVDLLSHTCAVPKNLTWDDFGRPMKENIMSASWRCIYIQDDKFQTQDFCEPYFIVRAMMRYVNFLKLKHKYKRFLLVPTLEIEYVWVSHMLRPSLYQSDCIALFGEIIDHDIELKHEYQCLNKRSALLQTATLYKENFGEEYLQDYVKREYLDLPEGIRGKKRKKDMYIVKPPLEPEYINNIPSYFDGIGAVGNGPANLSLEISLKLNEVLLDYDWLKQFCIYMKDILDFPANSSDRRKVPDNVNKVSGLTTHSVYEQMCKAYERFLYMACKYPPSSGTFIHPTHAIDLMWHAHMICPVVYNRDSLRLLGYLLDHEPIPEHDQSELDKSEIDTAVFWLQEFQCPQDMEHKHALKDRYFRGSHLNNHFKYV